MRYVAKVHVLDVLDQIVVSGYIYDADPLTGADHEATEFAYQCPSTGVSEPLPWLLNSLYRAFVSEQRPSQSREAGASPMGGPHTISESRDIPRDVMG